MNDTTTTTFFGIAIPKNIELDDISRKTIADRKSVV